MAFRRVVDMVGFNNEFYKPFALRGLSPKERLQFIEWCYYESEYRDKLVYLQLMGLLIWLKMLTTLINLMN